MFSSAQVLLLLAVLTRAQETVLGVYMFHRHGDRTPKALAPANLTDLGYAQVYSSGNYYRSRYIAADASIKINGINTDIVKQSQITVTAPADTVLQNSATGFLQGLYPPVGAQLGAQVLRNTSTVESPMNGYQLIPVGLVSSGSGSEDNGWLQASTGCANAESSSNDYFYSPEYMSLYSSTVEFYQNLLPVVNATFNSSYTSYKNAYTIFDLINVATIHNATISSDSVLTPAVFQQLGNLANIHEYNLAYNASSEIRAIAGKQLAAEIVDFLNMTITSNGTNKIGIQFGNYATFTSLLALAGLPAVDSLFYGIPDYASSMVYELYTNQSFSGFPSTDQLNVRFFFHNGTTNSSSPLQQYQVFGNSSMDVSWDDFTTGMGRFSVGTTEEWCVACGNTTGTCAPYASEVNSAGTAAPGSSSGGGSGNGISKAVAGVIGAFVTLGVIILVEGAIFLFGGLSLVSKKRLRQSRATANGANGSTKA